MQQAVEQHGTMSSGEDKAITVWPRGIGRRVLQETGPEHIGHRGRAHGHARMPRIGFLDPIHSEEANGINAKLVKLSRSKLGTRCCSLTCQDINPPPTLVQTQRPQCRFPDTTGSATILLDAALARKCQSRSTPI